MVHLEPLARAARRRHGQGPDAGQARASSCQAQSGGGRAGAAAPRTRQASAALGSSRSNHRSPKKSCRAAGDSSGPAEPGRSEVIAAVTTLAPPIGVAAACAGLGLPRASFYRQRARQAQPVAASRARRVSARALGANERQAVLDLLRSDRFVDLAPAEVYAALLDEGTYLVDPNHVPHFGLTKRSA